MVPKTIIGKSDYLYGLGKDYCTADLLFALFRTPKPSAFRGKTDYLYGLGKDHCKPDLLFYQFRFGLSAK